MMEREYAAEQTIQQINMLLIHNNLPISSQDFVKWVNELHLFNIERQIKIIEAVIALANSNWIIRMKILPFLVICRNTLTLLKR